MNNHIALYVIASSFAFVIAAHEDVIKSNFITLFRQFNNIWWLLNHLWLVKSFFI